MQFLPRIAEQTDAVLNITTGGSVTMTLEQRLAGAARVLGDGLAEHGFDQFRHVPHGRKPRQWKHDWEVPYLQATEDGIFRNTFRDIRYILETWARRTAPASNSSATTSATSTTWPTSSSRAWSSRRS